MNDLNAIVAAHGEAVWRTSYRLLNRREDALDCYQETFLAAFKLAEHSEVRHWRALLVRIATRRAMDLLRLRYDRRRQERPLESHAAEPCSWPRPLETIEGDELREHVRRVLADLPPLQAEAFWLRHVEQLTPAEVADLLEIEQGHVRVLTHRAATALREQFGASSGHFAVRDGEP